MNLTFQHPWWLLLLLALPAVALVRRRYFRPAGFQYSSVRLALGVADLGRSTAGLILGCFRYLALVLLIVALARPQLVESEQTVNASGVDIVIAIDLSGSMRSEDWKDGENRLDVARRVTRGFIAKRPNDRIGLVAFAGRAYIASPLTLDHDFLTANLDRLTLGSIEDGTAIGSALVASVNRLRDLKSKSKLVILLTDGQSNAGEVPPLVAAEAAQALGIKVYTIGVGTQGFGRIPTTDFFGRRVYQRVAVDIDEPTLKSISEKTGARYFRGDNPETLARIFAEIDRLEKTEVEVKKYVRRNELFHWFAVPGLVLVLLELILGQTFWRRLP